jgi:predicted 2-oxoglutarate/Fe(II)-dependent dioxygenase YbiX
LSLSLSDPNTFEGGELEFYNGGRPIEEQNDKTGEQIKKDLKSRGTIAVFDSRDWHRVKPVVKGVRYSIVCWATGADFK